MALTDKLATRGYPRNRAGMDAWYLTLPADERNAIDEALASEAWEAGELMDILESEGAPVPSVTTFRTWRREHVAH